MAVDWSQFSPVESGAPKAGATLKPPVNWSQFKPADDTSDHSTIGDIGRSALGALETGAGEGVQGIGDVTGWEGATNLGKRIQAAGARESANVSPQFAEATSQPILSRKGFTATNIASKAINSVAGMAPQLAGTAIAGALGGGVAAIPVGAALFGTQGEAAGRNAGEEQVAALTPQELAKVPGYSEAIAQGMSPEQFRAQLSEKAAGRGALTQGLFGAGLGVAGEIPGVGAAGRAVASKLTRPLGERAAQAVGKGVAEGAGFAGINAAGQTISNLTNPVPTPAMQGVGEAAAAGVLPGFVLGGARGVLTRPTPKGPLGRAADTARETGAAAPEPNPGAAPGSLSDAANVLHRTMPETTEANTAAAKSDAVSARIQPPPVPWVNTETGEVATPSDNQVLAALHGLRDEVDAQRAAGNNPRISSPQIAAAWGIPTKRFNELKTRMNAERRRGVTTTDAQTRAAQEPAVEPAPENPAETLRASGAAQDARLRGMQGELEQTGDLLGGIRQRVDALKAAQGETPAEAPAGPRSLAADADQLQQLAALREKRQSGAALTPFETNKLVDLMHRDANTARIGNGERIPGVQNMDALKARQNDGKLGPAYGFVDADNFKAVNDTLGHATGDHAIATLGDLLAKELGPGNVFHRGGDEFVLNHADPAALTAGLERVRGQLRDAELVGTDANTGKPIVQKGLGISFGTGDSEHAAEQAQAADKAARLEAGERTERRTPPRGTADDRRDHAKLDQAGREAGERAPGAAEPEAAGEVAATATEPETPPQGGVSTSEELNHASVEQQQEPQRPAAASAPGGDGRTGRTEAELSNREGGSGADGAGAADTRPAGAGGGEGEQARVATPPAAAAGEARAAPENAAAEAPNAAPQPESAGRGTKAEPKATAPEARPAGEPVAPSAPEKAPAVPAEAEAPASSSEPSKKPVEAESTANVSENQPSVVETAAKESAAHPENERAEPTPAQHEAGNFKMGHVNLHGLDVTIEVPKGGLRRGTDRTGKPWERPASDHYGYVRRTEGADGEQVDVYLGPHAEDPKSNVFVIDQVKPGTKTFDEHKAMVGYATGRDARASYDRNFPKGLATFGGIRKMSMDEFKDWVKHGDTTKPASDRVAALPRGVGARKATPEGVARVEAARRALRDAINDTTRGPRERADKIAELRERVQYMETHAGKKELPAAREQPAAAKTRPAPKKAPAAAVADRGNTKDAGEELWANRRNSTGHGLKWNEVEDLNATLKAREVVKSRVWPRPDYEKLVDEGMNPVLARVVKQVYDAAAAKPHTRGATTDAQYQAYLEGLNTLRDALFKWARRLSERPNADELLAKGEGPALSEALRMDNRDGVPLLDAVFPYTGAGRSRFRGSDDAARANNRLALLLGGNKLVRALQITHYDIEQARKAVDAGWPKPQEAWQKSYEIRESKPGGRVYENGQTRTLTEPEFFVAKKGGRVRAIVAKGLKTRAEAEAAARADYEKRRKGGGDNAPEEPRVMLRGAREGVQRRAAGEDVTSDGLKDAFGFRGVNFGNWMKGDGARSAAERQAHLNHAYDSLMDLADLLNVPPRALSLDGKLGIAFGAQGSGGKRAAAAHFVPGVNEINLTRESGAGSLAHEWAHALDHYFATLAGDEVATSKEPFLTEHVGDRELPGVRPEIAAACKTIVDAMNKRPETPQEAANRINALTQQMRSGLDRDLANWRKSLASQARGGDAARDKALAEFDDLAARLRRGELGDGYVSTGKGRMDAQRQNVGLLHNLYKDATGHRPLDAERVGYEARELSRLLSDKAENAQHALTNVRSEYAKQARLLEGSRKKPYWSTNLEKFARAFQSYVIDKLAERGAHNHYLSRPQVSPEALRAMGEMTGRTLGDPYPRGVERERIDKAFDTLIGALEHKETGNGNVALFSRRGWDGFPDAVVAHKPGVVRENPDYAAAKGGDDAAALRLAKDVVTPEFAEAVKRALPDGSKPTIVPVLAVEQAGKNRIPLAAAKVLGEKLGLPVATDIVQSRKVSRGGSDAMRRVATFAGEVKPGDYILLDDTLTQGGTLAQLKTHIEDNGGRVVLATALTGKDFSRKLALEPKTLDEVRERFGPIENWWRGTFGHGFEGLTQSEARAILAYKPRLRPDGLRNLVAKARNESLGGMDGRATGGGSQSRPLNPIAQALHGELARSKVQEIVDRTTAKWGDNQPRVRVEADAEGLPASAKEYPGYKTAEGYYDRATGTAYLVASNLRSERRAMEVLAHEAIGHHGVENVVDQAFGEGAWQKVEDAIGRLDKSGRASDAMRSVLQETHRRYPAADPRTFAKEFLAVSAEKGIRNAFLDRVVTAIRKFLRQIMPKLKLSDHEVRQAIVHEPLLHEVLMRADRHVRESAPYRERVAQKAAFAFSSKPDTFYSALTEAVARGKGAPKKADATAWKQWLDGAQRRGEFKGAEREWMGLDAWLDGQKGPITREALVQHVRDNQVRVQEVVRRDEVPMDEAAGISENDDGTFELVDHEGAVGESTKFGDYTLPGGRNYRELLLTLPVRGLDDFVQPIDTTGWRAQKMYMEKDRWRIDTPDGRAYGLTFPHDATPAEAIAKFAKDEERLRAGRAKRDAQFRSQHFEEPDILAHVRMNDRTGPDGERILHVEEVQSDWHQAGRKRGYNTKATPDSVARDLYGKPYDELDQFERSSVDLEVDGRNNGTGGATGEGGGLVPDAPFKKEWPLLAMKRVLRYAAEHDYDKVTWTTGDQQAERYDLSKQVKSVSWKALGPESKKVSIDVRDGADIEVAVNPDGMVRGLRGTRSGEQFAGRHVSEVLGKELADRILASAHGKVAGEGLKVGGSGMRAFYDKLLPNEIGKYVKKWGAKVGEASIDASDRYPGLESVLRNHGFDPRSVTADEIWNANGGRTPDWLSHGEMQGIADGRVARDFAARNTTVHSVDITPAMRESVMQGQPLFSKPENERLRDVHDAVALIAKGKNEAVARGLRPDLEKFGGDADVHFKVGDATHGLKHIVDKRGLDTLGRVLRTVALGEDVKFTPAKKTVSITRDGTTAVLSLDEHGNKKTWLLTGWEEGRPDAAGEVGTRSGAMQGSPTFSRAALGAGLDRILAAPDSEKPKGSFSRPEPADNERPSDPSREPHKTVDDIQKVLQDGDAGGVKEKAKGWLRGKFEDFRPAMLGALQTRHLLELMEDSPPLKGSGKQYGRSMQQMDADRQQLMAGAPDAAEHPADMLKKGAVTIAQDLRKFAYGRGLRALRGRVRPEAQKLFDMMHAATIQRMDPDKAYERLTIENAHGDAVPWTHEGVKARLKLLRELALQRGGDPWSEREKIRDEIKYLRNLPKMERARERNWPKLQADYMALPEEAKVLYRQVRDWYSQYRDETEKALIRNIEALDMPETYRRGLVQRMRLRFEEARREGVYFPLNRDGDFWIAFKDIEGNEGFKMFETAREFERGEKKLRAAGFQIDAKGRRDHNMKAKDAPSGTFVRQVIDVLQQAKVSESVQDEVYQTFLRSLPELSMRKHAIHRKNIAGYSEDALRAFAKNGYHGAHQLARLRHAQDMQFALEAMRTSVDNWRRGENSTDEMKEPSALEVAKADALVGEMAKRHDWIMHPTDQRLANMVNSLGFIYYLGASPASALTNLTQVVQTVLPVLGAEHGWPKAMRVLGAAWRDAARTGGHMDRTLKDPEERRAFMVMQQRGDFSKTQSHTLAGLAEGNVLQTSPAWSRTMNAISWMFHTAEVINREATGMAAYRLARAKGMDFQKAVEYAGKTNADANFDYAAANRPRYMQGNVQRIALQFKNYSVGMSWLFYRNLFQAMKGETPEIRRVARRTVTGILGMTAILAGATGLPVYNAVRMTANAANTLWGDDNEPWNFDDAFHRWLADNLGPDAARLIAEGPTNYLTGANIASRTSMANLWIRDDDQRLEGADAYHALLENLAGPIGGIVNNWYVGIEDVRRGHLERGVERMLPTAVKNSIKSLRYAHEGVNSLRGDPIVPDVSGWQELLQAVGFQPAAVADQYRINTAMKNFTGEINDRRINLMNAYALALKAGDDGDLGTALRKINAFNRAHPEVAITAARLRASLRQRARLSAQARHGVILNKRLALQAEQYAGVAQ